VYDWTGVHLLHKAVRHAWESVPPEPHPHKLLQSYQITTAKVFVYLLHEAVRHAWEETCATAQNHVLDDVRPGVDGTLGLKVRFSKC
jgi:hypothetical protein